MALPRTFKVVRDPEGACYDSVRVTLFRGRKGVCGWYIGPLDESPVVDIYLPASSEVLAPLAILKALDIVDRLGVDVCIIDPEDLWAEAWQGRPSQPN